MWTFKTLENFLSRKMMLPTIWPCQCIFHSFVDSLKFWCCGSKNCATFCFSKLIQFLWDKVNATRLQHRGKQSLSQTNKLSSATLHVSILTILSSFREQLDIQINLSLWWSYLYTGCVFTVGFLSKIHIRFSTVF